MKYDRKMSGSRSWYRVFTIPTRVTTQQDTDVLQKNLQKAYAGWAENGFSEHYASMFNRLGGNEVFKAAQRSIEDRWAQTGKKISSVVGASTSFKRAFPEVETALSKALEQAPRMDISTTLPRFATRP